MQKEKSKFELAQYHIDNMEMRLRSINKNIEIEQQYLAQYMKKNDYFWIENCGRKLKEYADEAMKIQAIQREMQAMLDFLTKEEEQGVAQ